MPAKLVTPKSPGVVDRELGRRIRAARENAAISQEALGRSLGITFQQIHKYETGTNRISASPLHQLARALGRQTGSFFRDLPVAGT